MSSNSFETENGDKVQWHIRLKTSGVIKAAIEEEAKREDRSVSYIMSRLLEKFYERKGEIEII